MKKFLTILEDVLFIAVLAFLCALFYSIHVNGTVAIFDYHFLRIISNSMSPTLTPNTCVIVKEVPLDELEIGDIITFVSHDSSIYGNYNTHRIYDFTYDAVTGEKLFVTKGDFFATPDDIYVSYSDVMGKFVRIVPFSNFISFLVIRLANSRVYFLVVIFPLVLCLLSYIYELIHMLVFGLETEEQAKARRRHMKQMREARRQARRGVAQFPEEAGREAGRIEKSGAGKSSENVKSTCNGIGKPQGMKNKAKVKKGDGAGRRKKRNNRLRDEKSDRSNRL